MTIPTYQYKCTECGYNFEKFQSIKSNMLRKCPKCGKSTLRRLIGPGGGIIFKGSGFYATDYRKKPKKYEKSEKTIDNEK